MPFKQDMHVACTQNALGWGNAGLFPENLYRAPDMASLTPQ